MLRCRSGLGSHCTCSYEAGVAWCIVLMQLPNGRNVWPQTINRSLQSFSALLRRKNPWLSVPQVEIHGGLHPWRQREQFWHLKTAAFNDLSHPNTLWIMANFPIANFLSLTQNVTALFHRMLHYGISTKPRDRDPLKTQYELHETRRWLTLDVWLSMWSWFSPPSNPSGACALRQTSASEKK